MVVIGIYLLYTQHVKLTHKTIFKAMAVFATCITIAIIMNEVAYFTGLLENHNFNMFYISPHLAGSLPVYSLVQQVIPFPFCLILYIAVFSLVAYLILLAGIGIKKLADNREKVAVFFGKVGQRINSAFVAIFNRKYRVLKIAGAAAVSVALFFAVSFSASE